MTRSSVLAVLAYALLAPGALRAQQWLAWEWNTSPGAAWTFDDSARTIRILQPGSYRFFATLDSRNGPLTDIQNVTAPGVNGAVTVSIIREGGQHLPGCTELGALDLTGATSSTVGELRVAGNAATQAGITFGTLADGDTFNVTGSVTYLVKVTTDLNGDVTCAALGDFEATTVSGGAPIITVTNDYAGNMTINGTGSVGGIALGGVSGAVTCNPNVGGNGVTISGDVSGAIDIKGSISGSGHLEIGGDITEFGSVKTRDTVGTYVRVHGDVAGALDVFGNVSEHELHCFRDVSGTLTVSNRANFVYASIQIDGDLTGMVDVQKGLSANATADYGHVRVLGALGSTSDPGHIWLEQGMSGGSPLQAYVCINYDGFGRDNFPDLDVWHAGSTVKLGSTTYTGPDDDARVHGAPPSCGKGDCDGSGEVDFFDIDPFVALIGFNPAAYPGRTPSVLLMAGVVEGIDSASLAAVLNEHVSDANRATLIAGIEQLAQTPPAGTPIDWPAVYEALTGN